MYKFPKLPFYASVGAIPESYLISLSYEEQILWLCSQVQAIKEGTPNYNYELLENKPSINNIPLIGNLTPEQLGLSNDYNVLSNKPMINGVLITGNKTPQDYGIQGQLIAGEGIDINGNVISATGGGGGGTDNYNLLSNKPSINLVTIEGHQDGEDLGLQNELISTIIEGDFDPDLVLGSRFDFSSVSINDIVLEGEPPAPLYNDLRIVDSNGAYVILQVIEGSYYRIAGDYDFLKIDENNQAKVKYSTDEYGNHTFLNQTGGRLLVSFKNCSTSTPKLWKLETGKGIEEANRLQNVQDKINKDNINTFLMQNGSYNTLSLTTGLVSEIDETTNKLVDVSQLNTASFLLDVVTYPIYNKVNLKGFAMDKYMIIYADSSRNVLGKEPKNLAYYGDDVYLNIPKGTKYIAFNFYDITNHPAEVKVYKINSIADSGNFYTEVDEAIYLNQDGSITPALTSGYYFLKNHTLYYYDSNGNTTEDNRYYNSLLYVYSALDGKSVDLLGVSTDPTQIYRSLVYDSTNHYWTPDIVTLNEVVQNYTGNYSEVKTSIPSSGDNNDIPTIEAVRTYVGSQSGTNFYTEIDQNLVLNYDGSTNVALESGKYYRLMPTRSLAYYKDVSGTPTLDSAIDMKNSILYYYATSSSKSLTITGVNEHNDEYIYQELFWLNSSNGWHYSTFKETDVIQNGVSNTTQSTRSVIPSSGNNNDVPTIDAVRSYVSSEIPTIATSITSSSTNAQVAGAKAVYDLINKPKATYVLDNNVTITPVSAYTPIDITTMSEDYNNDSSTFSFNTSTGEITVLKTGTYQFEISTQIRGSVNTTSTIFLQKGFGFRTYRSGTLVETFTIAEQCYLTEYANLFGKISYTMQAGDIIKPMGYSRIMSGTSDSTTSAIWGYKRTNIDIQFLG